MVSGEIEGEFVSDTVGGGEKRKTGDQWWREAIGEERGVDRIILKSTIIKGVKKSTNYLTS
jgi:hypothetical protein